MTQKRRSVHQTVLNIILFQCSLQKLSETIYDTKMTLFQNIMMEQRNSNDVTESTSGKLSGESILLTSASAAIRCRRC